MQAIGYEQSLFFLSTWCYNFSKKREFILIFDVKKIQKFPKFFLLKQGQNFSIKKKSLGRTSKTPTYKTAPTGWTISQQII
jgi:hypothetical protein